MYAEIPNDKCHILLDKNCLETFANAEGSHLRPVTASTADELTYPQRETFVNHILHEFYLHVCG